MREVHRRLTWLFAVMFGLLLSIAAYYFYHQIINGPVLARKANLMRTRGFSFADDWRGAVFDTHGSPLTNIETSWGCFCVPDQMPDIRAASIRISPLLALQPWQVQDIIMQGVRRNEKIVFLRTPARLSAAGRNALAEVPGVVVVPVMRRYSRNGFLIHLLGQTAADGGFSSNQTNGVSGIEERYNEYLRAEAPIQTVRIVLDGRRALIPGLAVKQTEASGALKAAGVFLAVDRSVQQIVETVLDRHRAQGAAVVLDVNTRDVLAIASRPTYNPYQTAELDADSHDACLMNKALMPFHPGSLFKVMVASAALSSGAIVAGDTFICEGHYAFPEGPTIGCWKKEGHGRLNLRQALAQSCNTAFISIGMRTGRKTLQEFVQKTGVTETDIIGYPDAQHGSGVFIDGGGPALANVSLGQQGVLMTPLQVANMIAGIVDHGLYKRPRLVRQVVSGDRLIRRFPADRGQRVIPQEVCDALIGDMAAVTSLGTGKKAVPAGLVCGGKTATAQTGQFDSQGKEILDTWFAGFYPVDHPKVVIVVLIQHGRSGSQDAAPVFRDILQEMTDIVHIPVN